MKKKNVSLLFLCMLLSLCLVACNPSDKGSKPAGEEAEGQMPFLTIGLAEESNADKLDATVNDSSMALYGAVYEPLVTYKDGDFHPGVAESWDISEDGKNYTFHLDKDKLFSDGSPVNAEAVKFTIERAKALSPDSKLQTLANLSDISIDDDYTVSLHFSKISNQVLNELCQTRPLRVMSPNSVENKSVDGKFKEPIGSGPFKLSEFSNESATFVPNENYNKKQPLKYGLIFKTISDGSSRALALQSGEVDLIGGLFGRLTPEDLDTFEKADKFKIYDFKGTESQFLAFNPKNSKLDQKMRQAISLGIDQDKLSNQKLLGVFQPTVQFANDKNQEAFAYQPDEAKKLIESEGYKLDQNNIYEKDGQELSFDLVIQTAEFPDWRKKAELIQSQLKEIGVNTNIQVQEQESYYDTLWTTGKYDLIFFRAYTDGLVPYNFLVSLYQNTDEGSGVIANDPELSKLIQDFSNLASKEDQQKQMDKIFKMLHDKALGLPINYIGTTLATGEKVKSLDYSGLADAPIDFNSVELNK